MIDLNLFRSYTVSAETDRGVFVFSTDTRKPNILGIKPSFTTGRNPANRLSNGVKEGFRV